MTAVLPIDILTILKTLTNEIQDSMVLIFSIKNKYGALFD